MARPKITLDWKKIDKLIQAGAKGTEIADILGINPETLYKRCKVERKMGFSEYYRTKRASGLALLKVKQYDLAMKGDRTMLVWLGKQFLGQTEKGELKVDAEVKTGQGDISKLSDDELEQFEILLEKMNRGDE